MCKGFNNFQEGPEDTLNGIMEQFLKRKIISYKHLLEGIGLLRGVFL